MSLRILDNISIEKQYHQYLIKLSSDIDLINIIIETNNIIYESNFNYEDFKELSISSTQEIIKFINGLIDTNKIEIKEENMNLKFILISTNIELNLQNKTLSREDIKKLNKENEELNKENEELKKENEELKKRIKEKDSEKMEKLKKNDEESEKLINENINENNESNKEDLIEEDIYKIKSENNKEFLINNNKVKNNHDNYIICEYNIKNKGNIQILNSYEEVVRNNWFNENGNENEKEIKDNCEIYLNENKIEFCYKYELEGKNIIKIKCINSLNNINFMFSECSSLISLNLSNFNTINVKDMSYMFYNCSSLTSLNLSNFNTNNVNNMSGMFSYCSSLTTLTSQEEKIINEWENRNL